MNRHTTRREEQTNGTICIEVDARKGARKVVCERDEHGLRQAKPNEINFLDFYELLYKLMLFSGTPHTFNCVQSAPCHTPSGALLIKTNYCSNKERDNRPKNGENGKKGKNRKETASCEGHDKPENILK